MIYNENASKYHRAMGLLLEDLNFGGLGIYQEYIVKDICPNHPNPLDRFDFYIPSLNLVIEVHGEQHYRPATFGGISKEKASINFAKGSIRDTEKALSAKQSGLIYINFSYKEKFTQDIFANKYQEAVQDLLASGYTAPDEQPSWAKQIYKDQKRKGKTGFQKSTKFLKANKE
jgi:hypothetical protein